MYRCPTPKCFFNLVSCWQKMAGAKPLLAGGRSDIISFGGRNKSWPENTLQTVSPRCKRQVSGCFVGSAHRKPSRGQPSGLESSSPQGQPPWAGNSSLWQVWMPSVSLPLLVPVVPLGEQTESAATSANLSLSQSKPSSRPLPGVRFCAAAGLDPKVLTKQGACLTCRQVPHSSDLSFLLWPSWLAGLWAQADS